MRLCVLCQQQEPVPMLKNFFVEKKEILTLYRNIAKKLIITFEKYI